MAQIVWVVRSPLRPELPPRQVLHFLFLGKRSTDHLSIVEAKHLHQFSAYDNLYLPIGEGYFFSAMKMGTGLHFRTKANVDFAIVTRTLPDREIAELSASMSGLPLSQQPGAERRPAATPAFNPRQTQALDRSKQETDIYEAVIRYRMWHEFGGNASAREIFFVSINGRDPSDELVKRFAVRGPAVKRMSEARAPETRGSPLELFDIEWRDEATVEVRSQTIFTRTFGWGMRHFLRRQGGRWVVTRAQGTWVS